MTAYGTMPNSLLDLREASQHPWMGITALLNSRPYLVIGKDGNKFILEGEDGDIQTHLQFEWKDATENSRLVAASRQEGSALAKGSVLGGYIVGNVRFHEGEWYVLQHEAADGAIIPVASVIERLEANRHDPRLVAAEIRKAIRYDGESYSCPECGSNDISFDSGDHPEFDATCKDCGFPGSEDDFISEPPDGSGELEPSDFDWYPDFNDPLTETASAEKTASTFEMLCPPQGIHLRTYGAMREAGLEATVQYPEIPAYPGGLTIEIPNGGQHGALSAMDYSDEVEMAGGNLEDVHLTVTAPNGQEDAVRDIINRLGGARPAADDSGLSGQGEY